MKILVSGSRFWEDRELVFKVLKDFLDQEKSITIIEGGCRGADALSREFAIAHDQPFITFNADWNKYGPSAGPIRNQEMVDTKPDLLVVFHDDLNSAKGTKDTAVRAKKAGIPIYYVKH